MHEHRTSGTGAHARRTGLRRALQGVIVTLVVAPFLAGFAPAADAIATGPFTVTMTNRESVRQLFYTSHEGGSGVAPAWTGSIASCTPGTVSQDFRDATLARINYFRAMAGVPSNVAFTAANNTKAQAAALMMSAQNDLSHDPPAGWACFSAAGHDGAATSNLALGSTGPDAIDQLMQDGGTGNEFAGHRRNMLNPQVLEMGTGSVPGTSGHSPAQAQLIGAQSGSTVPARDSFVAWPPKGFVPYQTVYPRWSFVLRNADFTSATVSLKRGAVTLPSTIIARQDFAGPGIVWLANGLTADQSWAKPAADDPITVTVGNVVVNGTPQSFTYTTTIFDPADADPAHTPLTITGSATPTVNQANAYSVNAIPNATGYQWRTTGLVPFTLNDGAEGGLTNFDAVVGNYNAVSTDFAATGTHSFRLAVGQGNFTPQTLTLKKTIVPSASTTLSFKTRTAFFDGHDADVEVSQDDGASWQSVYAEAGSASFTQRNVSLAAFANKQIRLRLRDQYAGGSVFIGDSIGWYVDDIVINSALSANAPVTSAVLPGTGFSFTPSAAGAYDIQVRANFAGSGFGNWSTAKRVTAGGAALTLATALDDSFTWSTTGQAAWFPQTSVSHDGVDAASSGNIGDNQTSDIITTITGPTTLSFWWKSDTEPGFDFLKVSVDGATPVAQISGVTDWVKKTINIASGTHTVKWSYAKDGTQSNGTDTVWLDQVTTGSK